MSQDGHDTKITVLGERNAQQTVLQPVTRLVSRPSVRIVDGRLSAVLELTRSAA